MVRENRENIENMENMESQEVQGNMKYIAQVRKIHFQPI